MHQVKSVFTEQREWLVDDTFHTLSSDKIWAKILDLGYGGARRALYNLCPKSARILSAAITRTIVLPRLDEGMLG